MRRRAFCASGVGTREWGEARIALEMDLRCCVCEKRVSSAQLSSAWGFKCRAGSKTHAFFCDKDLHHAPALGHNCGIVA